MPPIKVFDEDILVNMKRKELIKLCKRHGIKCTGKNVELIEQLLMVEDEKTCSPIKESISIDKKTGDDLEKETKKGGERSEMQKAITEQEIIEESQEKTCINQVPSDDLPQTKRIAEKESEPPLSTLAQTAKPKEIPTTTISLKTDTKIASETTNSSNVSTATSKPPNYQRQSSSQAPPKKPKFDLKASLKKPLSYKPYTGPLKPFEM